MSKLSAEDYEYRRTENSVSDLIYHFVFVPKRRKPVLIKEVAGKLQEIIFELVKEHNWRLIALEIIPDQQIAHWVKGRASSILRKEFPELKKLPTLWTPTYFVASTGQVSTVSL
ncbi:MAG: IS200/IS605 family transposase [Gomphosphaeria aponina SAG 52.96 = DSM 107014]|uniref:IS200/IS605 family transposase n=1 Tax=Gomphosphaeria aponina SAG 52.96 = DSM 107014 TaxID=1521640 RepID=A0A941GYQ6_9CHRO|nr:IS200/IS605 family transposase [Gomphosphaeria aponina SAG 52.96 = DSM 107014]